MITDVNENYLWDTVTGETGGRGTKMACNGRNIAYTCIYHTLGLHTINVIIRACNLCPPAYYYILPR